MLQPTQSPRKIQSFVRRSGRLSASQKNGLTHWADYGLSSEHPFDFVKIFNNHNPLILEIGFGNGDSLLEMARLNPQQNYLGIEVYQAGIGRLLNKVQKLGLANLKVINADAVEVLSNNIRNHTLAAVLLFFPDPWHKKKHHKRRIVSPQFLQLLTQKIMHGGVLHLATDWQDYAQQMMQLLSAHRCFKNTQDAHNYIPRPKRPLTKFEQRSRRLGLDVWDLIFTVN